MVQIIHGMVIGVRNQFNVLEIEYGIQHIINVSAEMDNFGMGSSVKLKEIVRMVQNGTSRH